MLIQVSEVHILSIVLLHSNYSRIINVFNRDLPLLSVYICKDVNISTKSLNYNAKQDLMSRLNRRNNMKEESAVLFTKKETYCDNCSFVSVLFNAILAFFIKSFENGNVSNRNKY